MYQNTFNVITEEKLTKTGRKLTTDKDWKTSETVISVVNGLGSDTEDVICLLGQFMCVCEPKLACTSGVHEFVMSLAVEPKYGELLVLQVFV